MAKIQRRARNKDGSVIEPMTLASMRDHGLNRVEVTCVAVGCGYRKSVGVKDWPNDFPVPDVGLRLKCPQCGAPELDSRPDWNGFRAAGMG